MTCDDPRQLMILPTHVLDDAGKRVRKRGHAGIPGNGPDGETCKTCHHYTLRRFAKTYRKCGLCEQNWTGGPGSDIRAKDPACEFWETNDD